MSDRHTRARAKSYVAPQIRSTSRVVWRTGMPQPLRLRPRRAPGRARLGRNGAGSAVLPEQIARTDTGEFRPGEPQPGPDGKADAGNGTGRSRPRTGVVVRVTPYAERGRPTTGPADAPERAGKTWDWFVNATCWDWYANSTGRTERGDAGE